MSWAIWRLLLGCSAVALGAWIGRLVGAELGSRALGTVFGAVGAAGAVLVVDALRRARLMAWLRTDMTHAAPSLAGFAGEVAFRVERALRRREADLVAERQRLADFLSAIEASPNGVVLLDPGDQIAWCNAVAADHLGLHPLRDRGQPITNLVRAPAFVKHLQSARWEEPVSIAMPASDRMLLLLVRAYGLGQKLLVTQDVTERARTDAMRRDLVANVSHEIRSPLTVLAGFIETLSSLELGDAERARILALMQQQAARMQVLVADLLTLARLEGSPWPATDTWVLLTELLRRVGAEAQALSGGRHRIEVETGVALEAAGSEPELTSAVANLASNAVRYTPEGGLIRLSCVPRPDGRAAIEVADTGIGIAREHLPRLTERFYRVDSSRSRETGGTGLGLAIVKHVVQRHGGVLDIESTVGAGSRFRIVLPAARVRRAGRAVVEDPHAAER
jgi:two-component system phosphate regulon sensor histidine kinase PhoR